MIVNVICSIEFSSIYILAYLYVVIFVTYFFHWSSSPIVLVLEAPLTPGSMSELQATSVDSTVSTLVRILLAAEVGILAARVTLLLNFAFSSEFMSAEPERPMCGLVVGLTRPWWTR
jgi:hypothetical protein